LKPEKYAQSFLTSIPNSVIVLMKIRNILVAPFKISNDDAHVRQAKFDFNKGDKIVFFYVLDKSPSELLLYANDHHLEAWLSFITHQDEYYTEVIATTVVKFNNKTGTIYFFLIKPFHKIIMKSVLKRMAKNISNNKLI
jgi:23S rRNA-/tRNA-specific pseudouridylate synthase